MQRFSVQRTHIIPWTTNAGANFVLHLLQTALNFLRPFLDCMFSCTVLLRLHLCSSIRGNYFLNQQVRVHHNVHPRHHQQCILYFSILCRSWVFSIFFIISDNLCFVCQAFANADMDALKGANLDLTAIVAAEC